MTTIAVIQADLDTTPLGTKSRLCETIRGKTVLLRTVERVRSARRIDKTFVLCPKTQVAACADLLAESGAEVCAHETGAPPTASLIRAARKWSLDSWRGGLGGSTCFDEYCDPRLISGLLKTLDADLIVSVPPAAAIVDPKLIDAMIHHRQTVEEGARLIFTQAPPGIAGIVFDASLAHELAETASPAGWLLSYKPDQPMKDLIFQPCCFEAPAALRYSAGRMVADTDRSLTAMRELLENQPTPDAVAVCTWLTSREETTTKPLPREVEIELTTDDPYPDTLLRPRGERVGQRLGEHGGEYAGQRAGQSVSRRGPIAPQLVGRIAAELAHFDDSLLVLGGFGDPLRHRDFVAVLEAIRNAPQQGRVYGVCVRSFAVDLDDERIEAMIDHEVDVLHVALDAHSPELYAQVHSPHGGYDASLDYVRSQLERLAGAKQRRQSVTPIMLPDMVKARDNVHELDAFHDDWIRRDGAVSISGFSHCAGQIEDRSVMNMAPATRSPCRRLRSRCLVLADGCVVPCDQDCRGRHAIGNVTEQSLEEIWQSQDFENLRKAHRQGRFDPTPLCAACDDWHRP